MATAIGNTTTGIVYLRSVSGTLEVATVSASGQFRGTSNGTASLPTFAVNGNGAGMYGTTGLLSFSVDSSAAAFLYGSTFQINHASGALAFGTGPDISISRVSAPGFAFTISGTERIRMSGSNLQLMVDAGELRFGSGATIALVRGADNRLDLATGDSFRIVSGELQFSTNSRIFQNGSVITIDNGAGGGKSLFVSGEVNGGSFITPGVTTGITASTTQTQGQGALTQQINVVATCANANDTVTLPAAVAGREVVVINNGAQTLQIFPASGDNLGAGVDASATLTAGSNRTYVAYDTTNWEII